MDLPFFFRNKDITSLKNVRCPAPSESLPYFFQDKFAALFVLSYWLREFLLSAFANRYEVTCDTSNWCYCITKYSLVLKSIFVGQRLMRALKSVIMICRTNTQFTLRVKPA